VAVSTLVLCGVDDQPRALRELRRVLRPGGQLLVIEHVRSGDPAQARLQDRVNWLNRLVVCCDCNRPTLDCIREAGFALTQVEHTTLPKAPKFVSRRSWAPPRPRRVCRRAPPRSPQVAVRTNAAVMSRVTVFRQLSRLKDVSLTLMVHGRNRWVVRPLWVRRLGLLVGAEGEAGGADVFPAVSGVNGSVPLAG
jgi:SAM-dependent methyltransferase